MQYKIATMFLLISPFAMLKHENEQYAELQTKPLAQWMQVAEELQAFKPQTHETMSQAWIVWIVPLQVGNARAQYGTIEMCSQHSITQVFVVCNLEVVYCCISLALSLWHCASLERALKTHSFGTRNWRRYAKGN